MSRRTLAAAGDARNRKREASATAKRRVTEGEAAARPSGSGEAVQRLWRAVLAGDAEATRTHFVPFLAAVSQDPLLYLRLASGGEPEKIAAVRSLQQTFRQLLRRLPRLGLIRETCQLIHTARAMERNHPLGSRRRDRIRSAVRGRIQGAGRMRRGIVGRAGLKPMCRRMPLAKCDEDPRDGDLTDALQHPHRIAARPMELA